MNATISPPGAAGVRRAVPVLLLALVLTGTMASPSAQSVDGTADVEAEALARELLLQMGTFLAGQQRFGVELQGSFDVVQASGEKIEFAERRTILVSRPDHLRVTVERSNGDADLLVLDGANVTLASPAFNVYAQSAVTGGIDGAVRHFVRDLRMHLPLAMLLVSTLPEELDSRVTSITYVEYTRMHGAPAHHLAARTEGVDFQVWIADGEQPLPLRVVLSYREAEGHPQFRAQFANWNIAPEIAPATFSFAPAEGARRIAFLPQLREIALQAPEATE